jgi:7-cyano-7-deazaguanine synthase in queuosine biosynthesis
MNTKYIIVKIRQAEGADVTIPGAVDVLTISLDQSDADRMLRNSILLQLEDGAPRMSNSMHDFLHFALAIYTIDQTVSRQHNGFQGWSRHLKVYFPVNELSLWEQARELLERYIDFLSGDRWEFFFRQNAEVRASTPQILANPQQFTKVSLLSGGLDSFVSAVDLLSNGADKPMFVSHYKTGTESSTQEKVIQSLFAKYGNGTFSSMRFYVQPNQNNQKAQKENSQRARSLLFISLGLTVANDLGPKVPLILPENGLISLNVPLTKTRLSSHSTRTTHPYFVDGLNQITALLGIENRIINPYRFKTKGEMMAECADVMFLQENTAETISCSHPEQSRYSGKPPGLNCGYCVPCIIRQAAEHKAGQITTAYSIDDVRRTPPSNKKPKGADYRAFQMALKRLESFRYTHSFALEVIRSGPIPNDIDSPFTDYVEVYKRGMEEVKAFLNS